MGVVSLPERASQTHSPNSRPAMSEAVVQWARALLGSEGAKANSEELFDEVLRGAPESWRWLVQVLHLGRDDQILLLLCAAVELDPQLRVDLAEMQGRAEWTYLTRAAVHRLTTQDSVLVPHSGALIRWQLMHEADVGPQDPAALSIDPFALDMILNRGEGDPRLGLRVRSIPSVQALSNWPVEETTVLIRRASEQAPVRVLLQGANGSGRRSFARCVADRLGMPLMYAESEGLKDDEFGDFYLRVHRQGLLLGHAVVWSPDLLHRSLPTVPALVPLSFILGDSVSVLPRGEGTVDDTVRLEAPQGEELDVLWGRFVGPSRAWPAAARENLVRRMRLQMGDLVDLGRRGVQTVEEAKQACRALSRGRLGEYAQLLDCPFEREDLIVSARLDAQLDDFLHEAFERRTFWEREAARRLFPRGRGLVGLFSGPPGTGKTMSAQVIAAELGLDLLRIDLAQVVSKYIGETSKNLARIFSQVREMNAVLFFDEADSLFSQRTEVKDSHDRYANADTNYLLQHLEEFDGVALLATNRKGNLDSAFLRRIRYVLEFPRPTVVERTAILSRLLGELVSDLDPRLQGQGSTSFAEVFELSGAQIKLAVLGAVFSASRRKRAVGPEDLLFGIERELRKEGRQMAKAERQRVLGRVGGVRGL